MRYDATWRHFLPWESGYDGPLPGGLAEVTMDHPQTAFRKQHLARIPDEPGHPAVRREARGIPGRGRENAHPKAGSKDLDVPLVQMNTLLGFVADAENDLIARHYQARAAVAA